MAVMPIISDITGITFVVHTIIVWSKEMQKMLNSAEKSLSLHSNCTWCDTLIINKDIILSNILSNHHNEKSLYIWRW